MKEPDEIYTGKLYDWDLLNAQIRDLRTAVAEATAAGDDRERELAEDLEKHIGVRDALRDYILVHREFAGGQLVYARNRIALVAEQLGSVFERIAEDGGDTDDLIRELKHIRLEIDCLLHGLTRGWKKFKAATRIVRKQGEGK